MPDQPTLHLAGDETAAVILEGFLDTLHGKDDRDVVTVLCSGIEQALQNDGAYDGGTVTGQTRVLLAVKAASAELLTRHAPLEFGAWIQETYGDDEQVES